MVHSVLGKFINEKNINPEKKNKIWILTANAILDFDLKIKKGNEMWLVKASVKYSYNQQNQYHCMGKVFTISAYNFTLAETYNNIFAFFQIFCALT